MSSEDDTTQPDRWWTQGVSDQTIDDTADVAWSPLPPAFSGRAVRTCLPVIGLVDAHATRLFRSFIRVHGQDISYHAMASLRGRRQPGVELSTPYLVLYPSYFSM